MLVAGGLVLLVVMWVPPVVQEVTGNPGNLTLLYDFFTAAHPGHPLSAGLWSFAAVTGILVEGPAEVMGSLLGGTPLHAGVAVAVALVAVLASVAVLAVGLLQRVRFAAGIGLLSLAGYGALIVAVTHVVGFVFGYLVVWAVALPVAACIGVGHGARPPRPRPLPATSGHLDDRFPGRAGGGGGGGRGAALRPGGWPSRRSSASRTPTSAVWPPWSPLTSIRTAGWPWGTAVPARPRPSCSTPRSSSASSTSSTRTATTRRSTTSGGRSSAPAMRRTARRTIR